MRRVRNSVKAIIVSLCLVIVFAGTIFGVVLANRNKNNDPAGGGNGGVEEIIYKLTEEQEALIDSIYNSQNTVESLKETDWSKIVYETGASVPVDKVVGIYENYFIAKDANDNEMIYFFDDVSQNNSTVTLIQALKANGCDVEDNTHIKINEIAGNYVYYTAHYSKNGSTYESDQIAFIESIENAKIVNRFDLTVVSENKYYGEYLFDYLDIELIGEHYVYKLEYVDNDVDMVEFGICLYTEDFISADERVKIVTTYENFRRSASSDNFITVTQQSLDEEFYYIKNNQIKTFEFVEEEGKVYSYTPVDNGLIIEIGTRVEQSENAIYIPEGNGGYYLKYEYKYFDVFSESVKEFKLTDGYSKASITAKSENNYFVVFEQKNENNNLTKNGLLSYYNLSFEKILAYETEKSNPEIYFTQDGYIATNEGILITEENTLGRFILKFNSEDFEYSFKDVSGKYFSVGIYGNYRVVSTKGRFVFDDNTFEALNPLGDGYFSARDDGKFYSLNANNSHIEEITNVNDNDYTIDLFDKFGLYFIKSGDESYSLYSIKNKDFYINNIISFVYKDNYSLFSLKLSTDSGLKYLVVTKNNLQLVNYESEVISYNYLDRMSEFSDVENYENYTWYDNPSSSTSDYIYYHLGSGKNDGNDYVEVVTPGGYYPTKFVACFDDGIGENGVLKCSFSISGGNLTITYDVLEDVGRDEGKCTIYNSFTGDASAGKTYVTFTRKYNSDGSRADFHDNHATASNYGSNYSNYVDSERLWFGVDYYILSTSTYYDKYIDGDDYTYWDDYKYYWDQHSTDGENDTYGSSHFSDIIGASPYGFTTHYTGKQSGNITQDTRTYGWGDIIGGSADEYKKLAYGNTTNLTNLNHWYKCYVTYKPYSYTVYTDNSTCDVDAVNPTSCVSDQTITLQKPKKAGYTFSGWTATVSSGSIKDKSLTKTSGRFICDTDNVTITLTPNWTVNHYTINLNFGYNGSGDNAQVINEKSFYSGATKLWTVTGVDNISNFRSTVLKTSNFYGKFDNGSYSYTSNKSTNSTQSVKLSDDSLRFNSEEFSTFGDLYGKVGSKYTCLRPLENSYAVYSYGIQYNIVGWAIHIFDDKKVEFINNSTSVTIIDYLKKSSTADAEYTDDAIITLYAIFEPKPYEIKVSNDSNFGLGSLNAKAEDEDELIVSGHIDRDIGYKYQVTGSDEKKTLDTSNPTVFEASNEILFEITIKNGTDGDFYIFDRIEILNVGYYTGSDYKYANVILTYDNGWEIWVQKNDNQLARPANGIYMSGNQQRVYDNINGTVAMYKYTSGTYKDFSFVDSSQVGINGFKIETGSTGTVLNLKVKNVGYAGDETDSSTTNSRGCADFKINNNSVTGRGKYGFTIKTFVKSNYKSADDVVTNWDYGENDANDAANETFVSNNDGDGNALLTTPNYLNMSHIIPISNANLVYQTNAVVGSVYYVWINGTKYTLRNSADNGFITTSDSITDRKGYYELKTDKYLRYNTDDSKQLFFYQKIDSANQFYISYYAVKCTGNVTLSNAKYIYFDGTNVYYLGAFKLNASTKSYKNVNYNNTQFLAIAPQQTKIKFSTKPDSAQYNDDLKIRYELDYYLSAIKFGSGAEYTLHAGDLLKHYHPDGKYDKFETLNSDLQAIEPVDNEYINYLGEVYETKYAYKITVGAREYILYFTVRVDSSGNYKDNYVMYFLMSTVGSIENKSITLTYKKLQYDISVNVTDFEGGNGFNENPDNATVNYYDTTVSLSNQIVPENNYDYTALEKSYGASMYPSEIRVIKISPKDGYLLSSVSLKLRDEVIMKFSLYNIGLGEITIDNKTFYSYTYSEITEGGTVNRYYAKYLAENNLYFAVDKLGASPNISYTGIHFSETIGTGWNINKTTDVKSKTTPAFESIYFLISGVYGDVKIDVETISFIEFDFDNRDDKDENNIIDNILGLDPFPRYNDSGFDYVKNEMGKYFIKFKKFDDGLSLTYYARFDNNVSGAIKGDDNKYYVAYQSGNSADFYFVKESPNDENCKKFILVYSQSGSNYLASYGGRFIVDEKSTEISELYPYLGKDETTGSQANYLLSDVKNLTILVNDGKTSGITEYKIGSQNILDCENDSDLLEASLVKPYLNTLRVMFIGKSSYFKNGVKIFASGNDYSNYFTRGLAYNDDSNDVRPSTESPMSTVIDGGHTIFENISEAEGRTSDNKELNIKYVNKGNSNNTNNLSFEDKLTYIQIDNVNDFFKNTIYNRNGEGFEFARKYFFKVDTFENNVSLNVNSYISNSSDKLATGTVTDVADTTNYGKSYYEAFGTTYTTGGVSGDHKVGNVLSNNTVIIKSDLRSTLTDFALTVSNEINGDVAYSPFMWLDNQFYQLDYVDDATSKYKKQYSWFNDTVLTNIKYDYFNNRDNSVFGQATTGNWQQQNVGGGMNKSAPVLNSSPVVYQSTPNPLISGYQIEYEYRVVPGYYLEYIVLETLDYGLFYIPLGDLVFSGGSKNSVGQIKYTNNTIDTKIHYSIEYINVLDSEDKSSYDSKYIIKFYDTQENDYHNINGLNSLGILSNNISINFFSKAYSIDINYNTNAENPDDAANHSYISSIPTVDVSRQSLIYDTMETLDAIATMEGYSFIGWGSKTYDGSHDRFDKVNLKWDSSSRWQPIKVGQNATASVNYFSFENTKRESLYNLGNSAYELYIKSSHADRKDTTGYFITDTGYAYSTTNQENYNFWSAYASIFKSSMKLRYPIGGSTGGEIKEFNGAYIGVKYVIDLYAVWKANVYAVELNFNDATKKDVVDNTKNNGSTYANLALGRPTLYDSYIWNEGKNAGNTLLYRYNIGSLGLANRISQVVNNFSVIDNTTTANNDLTDDYYCYVTYDRNDWYVISAKNNKDLNTAEYSIGTYAAAHTKPFINDVGGKNQLDFVIDRYGYSWLGWFSEKLANTYENKFTDSNEIVFGSDYYYTKKGLDNHIRAMPYLRGWEDDESHPEVFVSIDEFETFTNGDEATDKQTSVYSEVVYRGEEYFKNNGEYYVYHYDYRTKDESGVYINNDFLNGTASYRNYLTASDDANDKSIFAYYDTSLTLDSYLRDGDWKLIISDNKVKIERKRAETGGDDANYRYITLYAYWLVNDYNVIIDYRDKEDNASADCDSIYEIGSTVVTNKAEIETDYAIDDIDGSGDKYNIRNTYFDDSGYAYVLNTATPNRVGYDFIGWSFFFRDPLIPTLDEVSKGFNNGQLNKYNGLQVANNNYILSLSTISARYYHTAINGENDAVYADVIALYNEKESTDNRSGANYNYSYYLSQLYNNKFAQLHKFDNTAGLEDWEKYNNEAFGDHEADGDRFIYIFAMWRAQTFTIDVNLNIDTEDLINGYDQDSAYSVGFYDSYNAAGNLEENEKGFVGINSLFVRQKPNEDNIINYGDVFAEIVSNLTFIIYFDEPFSSAVFTDPNAAEVKYYYLADLFAVSTGYYLIDWLYDSDNPASVLISNSLRTEYGYYSNVVNKNEFGSRTTKSDLDSVLFDYEYYQLLYNTNYKDMTGVDITEDNGLAISGKKFEVDNTNKLADSETNPTAITDGNNASFASTNFGYIVIDGTKCYIQPEFVDAAGDGITDSYHLYYKYDGVKYYVVFFDESENGPALTNDLTYMYYKPKDSTKKYVVRFDSEGNPYYVANTTYKDIKYFPLKVAIFNAQTFNENVASIEDKKTCVRDGASNGYDKYESMGSPTFVPQITRQFTVYAHWEIKDDFYVSYTNGNSGQDEIIEGEPTGNVYKSNVSNQGLAGFYASYLNGSNTPTLKTENKVSAGGNSYLMGYDIDSIRHNYKTYDDFGFDVIPFLNGRFISEVAIEFDRLEAVTTSNVTTAHQKVKYKLTISFEWVNNSVVEENIVKVTEIKLWRFDPALSPVKYCPHCMEDREEAEIVSGKCATCNNEIKERQVGDYKTMPDLTVKLNTDSQIVSIKTDDENTEDLYTYLSVLSHVSFSGGMPLFDISDYGTDAGGSNVLAMRDGTAFNRRDVNMLRFNFTDLLSSVYVTCKFSVQTYDLKVHHLFDENGDTFIQSTTDRASYTSQYTEILKDEHYESKDSLESSNVWTDTTPTGKNQALATVPINLTLASAAEKYNIPYGYFLYGSYYDSALVGYRPMDDYYGVGANNGLNYKGDLAHKTTITYMKADGVTPIVEEVSFDGFNFIYADGNYTKGRGGTGLDLDGDGGDGYIDQGSPLLGSTVNFPTKSIRYNKSFYLFKGWYEISGTNGGYITFDAYNDIDEASYLKRNIVLYGYYYSNNTPTNIQFYTWNNDWNENSPAYLPYTNNADEYTLSSSDEMSPFIVDSGYLAPSANAVNYVDEEGRLILKSNVEYGVDSSRFSLDEFTGYELSNSNPSDLNLLNNILKTYWYYEETYTVLYAKNVDGEETVYIKYDPEVWSEYEYIQLPDNVSGMIVNTEQYEQFIKDGVTSFERLAMTSIEGTTGTATLEAGGTVEILYDSTFAKYYFINPADGRYYFFNKDVKNTVMTKRILKKKAFYYEYGSNQIREVKVNSSDDMGNTKLYILNDSTGEFDIEKPLTQEIIFTYGNRFAGAELYAMVGVGSSAKYYKYHKVPESVIENAAENSFIDKYEPRYYVDIDGVRYYTMIHKNRDKGTHNDDRKFVDLFTEDGVKASSITYNITTLNNYYVLLDDVYYKINYYEYVDAHGSKYVNPMQSESTVTLPYGNSTKTYYFDYENNSNTSGLFEKYNAGEYSDAVLYEYRIYTPISKNYTLNAVLKNNVWISSDITLNAFPSLNMDYWYSNPDYVLLGYINVSNIDIEIIKRNENEGAVFENSQFSYIPALNQLVNTDEYLANQNPGSYTVFGTVDWFNNRLTEADSGNIYSIYFDEDIDKYYFLYPAEDGSMVYYYFANNETNVVQIMHEQGGQLFNAYADYIDNKYSGGAYADLRARLKEAVAGKAKEFGLSDLLRSPLFVDSYQLSSIDHKSIERVIMRISSQFVFTWEEICAAGLETFCSTVPGLAVSNGDGTYKITISSTFKYAFSLVTTKTQITTNIYAIPVFVPDVIRFTETDAFSTGAVSISGNTVKIDYSKMNVSHYDILNQMLYQSDYVWDLPELPAGATPENIEERNQLLRAADWLQFVMINSDQFEEMSESIIGCDVKLDTMITEHNLEVISQETLTKDNQVLSFDMTGLTGEYYVFAFYYPIGTAANANKHIHRVSDNYVKITVDAGTIIDFEIVENTMAKS